MWLHYRSFPWPNNIWQFHTRYWAHQTLSNYRWLAEKHSILYTFDRKILVTGHTFAINLSSHSTIRICFRNTWSKLNPRQTNYIMIPHKACHVCFREQDLNKRQRALIGPCTARGDGTARTKGREANMWCSPRSDPVAFPPDTIGRFGTQSHATPHPTIPVGPTPAASEQKPQI